MKSQTQRFRAIIYSDYNDGRIHDKNTVIARITRLLETTEEWVIRWFDILSKSKEIEWCGNAKFVVKDV
jgi:hypothetical protein